MVFAIAQFLGFIEVVRREGPRERSFLQAGNPQGADTLSTLVEGFRFVLAASPQALEYWYLEGTNRTHPGARNRRDREEVLAQHAAMQDHGCIFQPDVALVRISRGHQRAIGSFMITTPMGAERHYTLSYGEFSHKLETEAEFRHWFDNIESDIMDLATGPLWQGEGPFGPSGCVVFAWLFLKLHSFYQHVNLSDLESFSLTRVQRCRRWTRVLLLQQLLVELWDLLDPDCVRLSLDRRVRLMPINWAKLPRLEAYQKRLQEISQAMDFVYPDQKPQFEGIKDLLAMPKVEEAPLTSSIRSMGEFCFDFFRGLLLPVAVSFVDGFVE